MNDYCFGIKPNKETKVWWGCRGIIQRSNKYKVIDVPFDRQSSVFTNDAGLLKEDFIEWINNTVFPKVEKAVKGYQHKGSFDSDGGTFHCEFDERNSGGYMYIGAWNNETK